MSELFDAQMIEGKSPRMKWLEKHGIKTAEAFDEFYDEIRWSACRAGQHRLEHGRGITEADAIADWARRNGVRLWNEEGL